MNTRNKVLVGAALLLALVLGALSGGNLSAVPHGAGSVAVAYADDCDGSPPPPDLDCPPLPTPTPTPPNH